MCIVSSALSVGSRGWGRYRWVGWQSLRRKARRIHRVVDRPRMPTASDGERRAERRVLGVWRDDMMRGFHIRREFIVVGTILRGGGGRPFGRGGSRSRGVQNVGRSVIAPVSSWRTRKIPHPTDTRASLLPFVHHHVHTYSCPSSCFSPTW